MNNIIFSQSQDGSTITNISSIDAQVIIDPNQGPESISQTSNEVITRLEKVELQATKSVDKQYAEVGEAITYTIEISNTGTVAINNVILGDTLPSEVNFIENSVTIDGTSFPTADPQYGINIGTIDSGTTTILKFQVEADVLPASQPITNVANITGAGIIDPSQDPIPVDVTTNEVITFIVLGQIDVVKSVDTTFTVVGEMITYTLTITNTGNVKDNNLVLLDHMPAGTAFVPNSLYVDGVQKTGLNPSIGANIGDLDIGDTTVVSFQVKIVSRPANDIIINTGDINFRYVVDPSNSPASKTATSNEVETKVGEVIVNATKVSDKESAILDDELTYTMEVSNQGTLPVDNVVFQDTIPEGTSFVEDSVYVNGVQRLSENPQDGINVGTIQPNEKVTVQFKVIVDFSSGCVPCPLRIVNMGFVSYTFITDDPSRPFSGGVDTNETTISVSSPNFKQLSIDGSVLIPCQKPDVEDILNTIVDVEIISKRLVNTTKSESVEGQILTGSKILIQGLLKCKIEYVADVPSQSVHLAHFEELFNSFIVVPPFYNDETAIDVEGVIEDVYIKQVDCRTIFKNVTLRLEALIRCQC